MYVRVHICHELIYLSRTQMYITNSDICHELICMSHAPQALHPVPSSDVCVTKSDICHELRYTSQTRMFVTNTHTHTHHRPCILCQVLMKMRIVGVLQHVAVCCSLLQCVAVCCSVVQCVAACCSVLTRITVCCSVL